MSLTMRSVHGHIIELQAQLEVALETCRDYHNLLVRASVPDSVTGRPEVQKLYGRFDLALDPRSVYGERSHG